MSHRQKKYPLQYSGLTLIELLVVMVILSILASVAMPLSELIVRRNNELELKRNLRMIRTAIDRFHQDWQAKKLSQFDSTASVDGYPLTLVILTERVSLTGEGAKSRRYLRRIPPNPFADQSLPANEQWLRLSYLDDPDTFTWGGQDVYDVKVESEKTAIDGSTYNVW